MKCIKKVIVFIFLSLFCCSKLVLGQGQEITIDHIWKDYLFYPRGIQGFTPMQHSDDYTVLSRNGIEQYSFETGEKTRVVLSNSLLKNLSGNQLDMNKIGSYSFDFTEDRMLLAMNEELIFRRSSKANYYIFDKKQNTLYPLSEGESGKQSFATFSNNGEKVAFVRDYNIFITDLNTKKEVQVTDDGLDNRIRNGMADWVYEEELSLTKAFEWSPDDSKIAFMRFDESHVKEFSMTFYGHLYPEEFAYKYPKAGEDNSLVDLFIYDVKTGEKTKLDLGDHSEYYFPRIYWLPNAVDLIVLKLNRHQNRLEFIRYNSATGKQDVVFVDENSYWLEVHDTYYFLEDNQTLITTSERDGYNHIYKITFDGRITQLTKGNWEVADICAVDTKNKQIYYLSNESAALNRDLYVIDFNGKKKKMLSDGFGWNRVSFNPNVHFYLNVYSDLNTPPIHAIYKSDGKRLRVLQDNAILAENAHEYDFSPKELFSFTTNDGVRLHGWMIKPQDFDPEKKYPVLMYVYGGPGSQEVNNSWFRGQDLAWYQLLAQKGYITVCVDGRGTASRGNDFRKAIYKQMGKLESEDQITTALYLKTLPYIDSERIGIWGWSFGGYLSSLAMFKSDGVFKTAIAVAPVTNWRYYDNIYTERFLQTPQENPAGYDDNSPITHAKNLKGNYLLIHGMTDDNVHFQNAVDLTTALIHNGKQFHHFFYPNMNHFINEANARHHLYTLLTNYILENL